MTEAPDEKTNDNPYNVIERLRTRINSTSENIGISGNDVDWFLRGSLKKKDQSDDDKETTSQQQLNNDNEVESDANSKKEKEKEKKLQKEKDAEKRKTQSTSNLNSSQETKHEIDFESNFFNNHSNSQHKPEKSPIITRSRSLSTGGSSGLFSRLSSKFRKGKNTGSAVISPNSSAGSLIPSSSSSTAISSNTDTPTSRRGSESLSQGSLVSPVSGRARSSSTASYIGAPISRSRSTPNANESSEIDPRFEVFLNFYNAHKNDRTGTDHGIESKPHVSKFNPIPEKCQIDRDIPKYDALGRPLPALPPKAPMPSALKTSKEHADSTDSAVAKNTPGLFTNFLKRHQSNDPTGSPIVSSDDSVSHTRSRHNSISLHLHTSNNNANSSSNSSLSLASPTGRESNSSSEEQISQSQDRIPGFADFPQLKRVTFSEKVFFNDPPQQIASRTPRKGEVEILSNGGFLIHKLTPEERKKLLQEGCGGVVVGGTGHLRYLDKSSHKHEEEVDKDADALNSDGETEQDKAKQERIKKISIDKPMVRSNKSKVDLVENENDEDPESSSVSINKMMLKKQTLDVLYARCCHLREILPIKSVLKQIPKDSYGPLPILRMKNPKPTLIEIITFADFISIAPILCVSFDGVSLSFEMFKIILASLVYKTDLLRLSLKNCTLDEKAWKLLCWFLIKNKKLESLDLTQCDSLVIFKAKKPKKDVKDPISRMQGNTLDRSDMDWAMFVAALISRGGIEDLVLTGCKISQMQVFERLFELALSKKTLKAGLAFNELTEEHIKIVANWFYKYSDRILGLDLGYNHLGLDEKGDSKLKYIIEAIMKITKEKKPCAIKMLSLNSISMDDPVHYKEAKEATKLAEAAFENARVKSLSKQPDHPDSMHELTEKFAKSLNSSADNEALSVVYKSLQASSSLYYFSKLPNLKFLDLSGNPSYLNSNLESVVTFLPLFLSLSRLHLEYNELSTFQIVSLCDALIMCPKINYLSLIGNDLDNDALLAVCNLVRKNLSVICVDLDYEKVPKKFKAYIGVYAMRNMESVVKGKKFSLSDGTDKENSDEEDNDDASGDNEDNEDFSLHKVSEELLSLLDMYDNVDTMSDEEKRKMKLVVFDYLEKVFEIRSKLDKIINQLVELKTNDDLSMEGKETLVRFCFIDNAFEKVLKLLSFKYQKVVEEFVQSRPPRGIGQKSKDAVATTNNFLEGSKILGINSDMFGNSEENDVNLLEDSKTSKFIPPFLTSSNKSSSQLSLKQLEQEEGAVMKNSRKLQNKGQSFDNAKLRETLLESTKVGNVMETLNKLDKEGVPIKNVFKKGTGDALEFTTKDDDTIVIPNAKLARNSINYNPEEDADELSDYSDDEKDIEELVSRAYDDLVDSLVKVRSTSHQ